MRNSTVRLIVSITVLTALATACSPKISNFEAKPRHICPGDEVELIWEFTGNGAITPTVEVAGAPNGSVKSPGSAKFRPTKPMSIVLHVKRSLRAPKKAQQDIEIEPGTEVSASIADPTAKCENGVVSSTKHVNSFGGLTITMIGVGDGNKRASLDVTRDDPNNAGATVTAHVTPDQTSRALAGLPINGDWVISSPLLPGETCDGPKPVLPNNLIVRAYAQCNSEGQP
ncbi:MAG: hypothetical protein JWP01_3973 [Myxococcales bacterium]|nr:hypothetical protein [Myxococcales bacterium]